MVKIGTYTNCDPLIPNLKSKYIFFLQGVPKISTFVHFGSSEVVKLEIS